ncbi:hypothetical protein Patl1_13504 [Pistacia atlantica]|uniref:Uncharacterized protein n=1 Tax=Pistacia atlantica TaxID=434234 RepID=A0ACC1AUI4_9ROSI|nr:hypothetical protein Patl1_13504 [Pistacia atlantica]
MAALRSHYAIFQGAKFLAENGHHLYFISTPNNMHRLPQIPDNLSSHLNFVQLPLPHAQGLPQGAESTAYFPIHQVPYLKQAQDMLQLALINFLKSSRSPSDIINGRRQKPEDFTVVPEWINFDFNIRFKLHEMMSHQEWMDSVSDLYCYRTVLKDCRAVIVRSCPEFEPEPCNVFSKLLQKPVLPVSLLPPSLRDYIVADVKWQVLKDGLDTKKEDQ